jgi:hypothetical protein
MPSMRTERDRVLALLATANVRRGAKYGLFQRANQVPFLGQLVDPVAASVLLVFALGTGIALLVAGTDVPVLQCAAGLLVCAGVYYTAMGLRDARAERHHDRIIALFGQLGSEQPAIQMGAVTLLAGLLVEERDLPRDPGTALAIAYRKLAIEVVLESVAADDAAPAQTWARQILDTSRGTAPAVGSTA